MARRVVAIRRDLVDGREVFTSYAQSPRGTRLIVGRETAPRGDYGHEEVETVRAAIIERLLEQV